MSCGQKCPPHPPLSRALFNALHKKQLPTFFPFFFRSYGWLVIIQSHFFLSRSEAKSQIKESGSMQVVCKPIFVEWNKSPEPKQTNMSFCHFSAPAFQ